MAIGSSRHARNAKGFTLIELLVCVNAQVHGERRCEFGLGADGYRRVARERWTNGADGIYLFNCFTAREWAEPTEPPFEVLTQIGDPKRLAGLPPTPATSWRPKTKPGVIIYEGTHPGWPWITKGPDGTLFCVFREGTEHDFSASGRDGGRTWSVPAKTNAQSRRAPSPPHLCRHNQTVSLIYADRRMVSASAARASDAGLLNWDIARQLPAYVYNPDWSPIPDGSYPASIQTGPQERLIVDYEIRPKSKRITGYFVHLPDA